MALLYSSLENWVRRNSLSVLIPMLGKDEMKLWISEAGIWAGGRANLLKASKKESSEIWERGELLEFLLVKALMYLQTVDVGVFMFNEEQNSRNASFFFLAKDLDECFWIPSIPLDSWMKRQAWTFEKFGSFAGSSPYIHHPTIQSATFF